MSNKYRGRLSDLGTLTELRSKEDLEAKIAKLTKDNEVKFKLVFTHQLEETYNFESLQSLHDPDLNRPLTDEERLNMHEYLGSCIDTYTGRTISNVEAHFRRSDEDDRAFDPVGGTDMPIQHFPIDSKNKARIHGYFNQQGYFVVTRLDWFHLYHLRKQRESGSTL